MRELSTLWNPGLSLVLNGVGVSFRSIFETTEIRVPKEEKDIGEVGLRPRLIETEMTRYGLWRVPSVKYVSGGLWLDRVTPPLVPRSTGANRS